MAVVMASVDRFAALLEYPDRTFTQRLAECRTLKGELPSFAADAFQRFDVWASLAPLRKLQETYTATFDLNAGCTLDLGWHLFGERLERGAFLVDLRSRLSSAGIAEENELPDYLPRVLKLLARMTPDDAAGLYARIAPAVDALCAALGADGSPYEHLVRSAFVVARPAALMGA